VLCHRHWRQKRRGEEREGVINESSKRDEDEDEKKQKLIKEERTMPKSGD